MHHALSRMPRRRITRTLVAAGLFVGGVAITTIAASTPALAADGQITGNITSGPGATPKLGAQASATTFDGRFTFTDLADAAGNYAIALPPGTYCVSFGASTQAPAMLSYPNVPNCVAGATPIVVASAATVPNINATLHPGAISGTVVGQGGLPLAGAGVYIDQVGGPGGGYASTNGAGGYVVSDLFPGSYCVYASGSSNQVTPGPSLPTCLEGRRVEVTADQTTANTNFSLVPRTDVPTGSISGKVTAAPVPTPVVSRDIIATTEDGEYGSTGTAADGTYTISGLRPGSYCVYTEIAPTEAPGAEVYDDKSSCADATRVVVGTGPVTNINFALEPGGVVSGTITTPGGVALPNASILLRSFGGGDDYEWAVTATSSVTGAYQIQGVPTGQYCLSVTDNTHLWAPESYPNASSCDSGATPISVTRGATTSGIDVELAAGGTIAGTISVPTADLDKISVYASGPNGSAGSATLDVTGHYTLPHLAPGLYCLQIYTYGTDLVDAVLGNSTGECDVVHNTIVVTQGATTTVDYTPALGGSLSGWALDQNGRPITRANVAVTPPAPAPFDSNIGDASQIRPDGSFSIRGIPAGTYCLFLNSYGQGISSVAYVNAPTCADGATPITVVAGIHIGDLRLNASPTGYVTGEITFPDGLRGQDTIIQYFAPGSTTPVRTDHPDIDQMISGPQIDGPLNYTSEVPAGTYCVLMTPSNASGLATQAYSGAPSCARGAQLVTVRNGEYTADIDFDLQRKVYIPLSEPRRVLDTRVGFSTVDGVDAGGGGIALGGVRSVQVAGRAGVPASAASVVLNVTAVDAGGPGFLTVWPCGVAQPLASNVNFATGQTVPNSVIARAGTDGKVCLFSSQAIEAVVDVAGYFPADDGFTPLSEPRRVLDTRSGFTTIDGVDAGSGGIALGGMREVKVAGRAGVPASAASVVLNVTAVDAGGPGFLTVWPCGVPQPLASNVNFSTGQTVPNSVIARAGVDGKVCLFSSQAIDAVVDVAGYFPSADGFTPLPEPHRLLDTRAGFSTIDGVDAGAGGILLGGMREVQIAGRGGVPVTAASVVLNVTAVDAGGPGFLTVWPCGVARPLASNVNFATGQTVPNSVIAKVGVDGKVCIFSSQAIQAVVDVSGYFPVWPPSSGVALAADRRSLGRSAA